MDLAQYTTEINLDKKQFEMKVDDHLVRIEFIKTNQGVMYLVHTEVPPALEGKGIGQKIVKDALEYLRENNLKLAPLCPFVAAYLKRHPEYKDLLAPGFNV